MKSTVQFTVDGYEISALFTSTQNLDISQRVKQILLSAFAANAASKESSHTLAFSAETRDNKNGSSPRVP